MRGWRATQALGYVASLMDEKELYSLSKEQLMARIDVAMGGRAAEEIFFGYFSALL